MPRVSIASAEDAPVVAVPNDTGGSVTTRAIFAGDRDPIHLYLHRLNPGAAVCFSGSSTDCLIYVWDGVADARGVRLASRSSAIVEYGASLTVRAGDEGGGILEFRVKDRNADRVGGHVHLLPSERVPRVEINEGKRVGQAGHADTRCPTCPQWGHQKVYTEGDVENPLN
jgi:hypothetical protein